jgi:MarR family transcriptional regulator, 2-MHQ and catechol-resistance regulon repressor
MPGRSTMSKTTELSASKLWIVLARCYRALALSVERSMGDRGLCLSDFMVLEALLHKGPLTISEIQAKILLASGSMTAAVDRVERRGLLVRKTTSTDRRARLLELTAEGRRLIEGVFGKHARDLEGLMSILDEGEKKSVYAGLKKLGLSVAASLDRAPLQTDCGGRRGKTGKGSV